MQDSTFNEIADLALRHTGQAFKPSKSYLMEARLSAISRRESFATLDDLAHCLKARPNKRFEAEIAAALTGKASKFFGDRDLIERIATHALPERLKTSTTGRLRIWCAGVSTGQEAYSLALRLSELDGSPLKGAEIEIIGTDISADCLQTAQNGIYGHFDVQKGLSIHRLMRHFSRMDSGEWQISNALRSKVTFRRHNLMEDAGGLGHFDLIICRNVIGDMAKPMQAKAIKTASEQLLPGGLLFAAPHESLIGLVEGVIPSMDVRGGYLRRQGKAKTAAA